MKPLADYRDDVWEPADAMTILRDIAGGAAGKALCLRVGRDGLRLLEEDASWDLSRTELPGTASYIWVLWSGSRPTLEDMVALHEKYERATRGSGGA